MRVFVFSPGQDTGGQGYRIARAFRRYAPSWDVRAMAATNATWLRYPVDVAYERGEAQRLYDAADVVHHKNSLHGYKAFEHGDRKPAVLHHQGTRLRQNAATVTRESASIGAYDVTSTVDLGLSLSRPSTWLPSPFDIEALSRYRRPHLNSRIRVAHAPTNRGVKGTEAVIRGLGRVAASVPIEFDLIERVPWGECLARKGLADVFVDQLTLGYGNNAIEAWAMGLPVVAGVKDQAVRARMIETWGELPFYETTAETFAEDVARLIGSPALLEEYAERGRRHVERFHAEPAVVALLQTVYRQVPASLGADGLEIAYVTYDYPQQPKNRSRGNRL